MSELYNISSSPHIRAKDTSAKIMLYVIIALLPASIFGVYNFGLRALLLIAVCIATCVASEWIFEKIVHKKSTITDFSAVLTGLLLALNLPYTLPIWQAVLGSVFAIVIVKMLFGGLGQNFMNPALGARCFLLVSFASTMTSFTYDGVTGATPLALMRNGESVDTMKMFLGTTAGTIGETSVIALLIGAVFLILMGVIDLRIPGSYLITFVVFLLIFSGKGFDVNYIAAQLCGGGLMLGAFFMATDYVTSPITPSGKIIYGILLGILTGLFRLFGANAEGVSFAIILGNLLVPIIEKHTIPKAFGVKKEGKKHASLWVNLLCGSLAIYSLLRPGKLNQSCGSNPPTAAFFRLLCFVHLPQKVRGIFALKMRKTGSAAVRSTTAEPVSVDFTVFWAIFALKARKLPDLSGRQIRQLIWCERGDLNSHVG